MWVVNVKRGVIASTEAVVMVLNMRNTMIVQTSSTVSVGVITGPGWRPHFNPKHETLQSADYIRIMVRRLYA